MKKRLWRAPARAVIACLIVLICLIFAISLPIKIMGAGSQAYTWKNVKIDGGGGFVPGIVFNPTEKNLVFARTDIGGAYRSTDGGNTWTQLMSWVSFDDCGLAGVDSIATDPVDPNRLYLQCGLYSNSWGTNGAVLRSSDKGNTFQKTDLPFKVGGNMPGRNMGERLAIDPNKNSIIYMGTREGQGLWKSTDYGATWNKVTSFPNPGTYVQDPNDTNDYLNHITGVVWVTFDKRTGTSGNATQTIYVGVADLNTSIYRSKDGGATWAAVPGQPTGLLPQHGKLASNGIMYIPYSATQGPYDGDHGDVWKLDTATDTWTLISPLPGDDSKGDCYFGYGGLAVDSADPNTLIVASLSSWWPDGWIWRSKDAGATWSSIWTYDNTRTNKYTLEWSATPWRDFGQTKSLPETSPALGQMIGSLEIDPFNSNRFMWGTGCCIWGCDNADKWDAGTMVISIKSIGMEETNVLSLVSPPSGPNLVSGVGDIAGFTHLDLNKSQPWTMKQPNLSSNTCVDFAENNLQFWARCGNVDKTWNATTNRTGFSWDGLSTWFQGSSEPANMPTNGGGGTIACSADPGYVVYAAGDENVQVCWSSDNGSAWTPCQGVPNNSKVRSDRVNPNKFYAFKAGVFYYSTDKGKTFIKSAATGFPTKGNTNNFKTVFGREGDIWVAPGGDKDEGIWGLWHSTDSGVTFTKLSNVQKAQSVGFGMAAPGQSYPAVYIMGTVDNVTGFFRSDDAGATWIRINDDGRQWGNANNDITGDRRVYGRVYIGTNGFGIIWGDPNGPTPTPVRGTPTPTTTSTPTPSPTVRVTATPTPTNRVTPTSRPSSTPTVTRRVTVTNTPTPTTRRTVTNTPTPTNRVTPTVTRRVTPSPTARVTNTPTPTRGTGNYIVTYVIQSDWGNGATISVTITNNTALAVNGWTLAFTFPGNQTITNLWNGTYTQSGATVSIKDAGFNGAIGADGGSTNFGFNLNYSGTNAKPSSFTLNGAPCQVQ